MSESSDPISNEPCPHDPTDLQYGLTGHWPKIVSKFSSISHKRVRNHFDGLYFSQLFFTEIVKYIIDFWRTTSVTTNTPIRKKQKLTGGIISKLSYFVFNKLK